MGHISQDSCTSVSFDQFSSLDAPEGMGAACKTECTPHNSDAGQLLQKIESKAAQSSGSNHVFLEGDCSLETARRCRTAAFQAHNMPLDVCIAAEDCRSRILTYPAFARVE